MEELKLFEQKLGFRVKRKQVTLEMNEPHDESFAYPLCLKFYDNTPAIDELINDGNVIIRKLIAEYKVNANEEYIVQLGFYYAIVGNLYYLKDEFKMSAGYFMKALSCTKSDITPWIELLFSMRAMGLFEHFENALFNFEKLVLSWQDDKETIMTQQKVVELIEKVS